MVPHRKQFLGHRLELLAHLLQLRTGGDQRDHDLDHRVAAGLLALDGGLDDGPDLHGVQAGLDDPQANAAQAEHGVRLVQRLELVEQAAGVVHGQLLVVDDDVGRALGLGHRDGHGGVDVVREELVQRRVQ
jgi:hypothetical protein